MHYMRIRSLNHSTYQHQYHIVWGTKYRWKYLKEYVKLELLKVLYTTVKKYPTLHVEAINVDNDHIHIQMEISPDVRVSDVVQRLKAVSSIHLKKKFKFIREMYVEGNIWSVGYFSSTIGLNEEQVKKYIEKQGKKDFPKTQRSFEFS
jgi:putative transposase